MFLFRGDAFQKVVYDALKQKKFEVKQKLSAAVYVLTCGRFEFTLDISDARRAYAKDKDTSVLDELVRKIEIEYLLQDKLDNFTNAQSGLRCLLVPEEESGEDWIEAPFSESIPLKRLLMYSGSGEELFPLSASYLKKWGIPRDVLFAVADRNMCEILRKTELYVSTIAGKIRALEFPVENTQLRSALMGCSSFKKMVSEKLGVRFLVLAPARESMLAVEDVRNDVVECFGPVVLREYEKSEQPLSTDVFLFSKTGISIAGRFRCPEKVEALV